MWPHFLDICKPNWSKLNCTDVIRGDYLFITDDFCTVATGTKKQRRLRMWDYHSFLDIHHSQVVKSSLISLEIQPGYIFHKSMQRFYFPIKIFTKIDASLEFSPFQEGFELSWGKAVSHGMRKECTWEIIIQVGRHLAWTPHCSSLDMEMSQYLKPGGQIDFRTHNQWSHDLQLSRLGRKMSAYDTSMTISWLVSLLASLLGKC